MSNERLTPKERAVIAAVERWRDGDGWVRDIRNAVDALRASRKRWKVYAHTPPGVYGSDGEYVGAWLGNVASPELAARICALLNADDERTP